MENLTRAVSLITIIMLTVGCGTESTPNSTVDAGAATDSGAATDAGTTSDASTGSDAGSTTDAATSTDAGTTADAGAAPTITTCPALADCVMTACVAAKFAKGCESKCLGEASTAALTSGAPLLACTQAKCVPKCQDSKEDDCLNDCITEECSTDFSNCIVGKKDGKDTCGSMFGCTEKCEADPKTQFTCYSVCFDAISLAGKKAFDEVMACNSKPGDNECISETMKCLTGGKSGSKKCAEGVECASKCSELKGDGAQLSCLGKCAAEIKSDDVLKLVGASSCAADFEEDCGAVMAMCLAPTGTAKCATLVSCVGDCKDDDDACVEACISKGSVASSAEFLEFALGCEADLPTCSSAFVTCMAPEGSASCATTVQCVSSCASGADEAECVQKCVMKVKAASVDLLKPALVCGAKSDTTSADCKAAIGKCIADQ